jgi:hypothetical protein
MSYHTFSVSEFTLHSGGTEAAFISHSESLPNPTQPSFCVHVPLAPRDPLTELDCAVQVGSFQYDQDHGYTLCWDNLTAFDAWKDSQTDEKAFEFIITKHKHDNDGQIWKEKWVYVCSRNLSGERSQYQKKTNRKYKVTGKKIGCGVRLIVKTYPNTKEVLGMYESAHSHPIGNHNLRFLRLPKLVQREIEFLLRLGLDSKKTVSLLMISFG